MPHERLGEGVCAYVIADAPVSVADIGSFLGEQGLARQKWPERVEMVDAFPRTASGKVQKNILRDRLVAGSALGGVLMNGPDLQRSLRLFERMLLIRRMEERLGDLGKAGALPGHVHLYRSVEHTTELQPLIRTSYAFFYCKKN